MRRLVLFLIVLGLAAAGSFAQTRSAKTLEIYVVDVEGGNASLFVAPSGESVLIDTGNGGAAAPRDAGRIMDAVKDAGLKQIDTLITTQWHGDHFGGMAEFASRIPIRNFIDHGPNEQQPNPARKRFCKTRIPRFTAKPTTVSRNLATRSRLPVWIGNWSALRAK